MEFVRAQSLFAAALYFVLTVGGSVFAGSPWTPVPSFIVNNQATKIIGLAVENRDGEKLGRVRNLIIELPSGEVKYVIVASGGFLGADARLSVMPAPALSLATAKRRTALLDINVRRWKNAPPFRKKDLADLNNAVRAQQIAQFYAAAAVRSPKEINTPTTPHELSRTSRSSAAPQTSLKLATEIIGRSALGVGRQKLGEVSDLLVDLEQIKPSFAIISAERLTRKDYTFAVPLDSFTVVSASQFALNLGRPEFDQARGFDEAARRSPGTNAVYRYHLMEADNTAVNARDRKATNLTASNQSENQTDLEITARVRQALVQDSALTFTAKNVKIITINGHIILRGPVKRDVEKALIQAKAEAVAGKGHVDNQLEVEESP